MERIAFEKIVSRIAAKVSPTPQEAKEEKAYARTLIKKLESQLKGKAKMAFVGSAARDTGLAGDKDIDLFVQFPVTRTKEFIVAETIRATKKAIAAKWEMHYAEHPYLKTKIGKYEVEVIPCFTIKPNEKIKSAVDRSPLHMDYLQKQLTEEQKRDVRVLKQLLKSNNIYGAEVAIQGFSGLLCEYLILNYRNIYCLIENARKWPIPIKIAIDPEDAEMAKKFEAPLVFIDAIDSSRNAAAAVNETQLSRFIALCQAVWEKPSETQFEKKSIEGNLKKTISQRETQLRIIEMTAPNEVEDTVVPQLRKTEHSIRRQLELKDFPIFGTTSFIDNKAAYILIECNTQKIPSLKKVQGPPVTHAAAIKQFLRIKSERGPYIEGQRWWCDQLRKTTDFDEALKAIVKKRTGATALFEKPISKCRILKNQQCTKVKKAAEYLLRREPWA